MFCTVNTTMDNKLEKLNIKAEKKMVKIFNFYLK